MTKIEEVRKELTTIHDEEDAEFNEMSDDEQESDSGTASSTAIEKMEDAFNTLDEAVDFLKLANEE